MGQGVLSKATDPHTWIGVQYQASSDVPGEVLMTLPEKFSKDLLEVLQPFMAGRGTASMDQARSVCGKAARMAQIIDRVQPWSSALYAALTAAAAAQLRGAREAPIGRVAVRRFSPAARLLAACLRNQDGTTGCLVRKLMVALPEPDANFQRVHFDVSS